MSLRKFPIRVMLLLIISVAMRAQSNNTTTGTLVDDRNNKTYKTITIKNQIWMAENLDFETENSWCYEKKDSNCSKYGRLYSWDAALNACPAGWHLPSDDDWKILESNEGIADAELDIVGYRGSKQGTILKAEGSSGFNALMAGYRLWWDGSYLYLGSFTDFWTSTAADSDEAWLRDFSISDPTIYRNRINKKYGNSVRCLKNN